MFRKIFIFLVLFLAIFTFFLPQILSSPIGTTILVNRAKNKFDGTLSIQNLSLSWLGPQTVKEVSFKSDHTDFSFKSLKTDLKLWNFFRFSPRYIFQKDGEFDLRGADIDIHTKKYPPVLIENLNATISPSKSNQYAHVDIDASVRSKELAHSGSFTIDGKIGDLLKRSGEVNFKQISADLKLTSTNFPSYLWSFILDDEDSLFVALLGDLSTISGSLNLERGNGSVDFEIDSEGLKTHLQGRIQDNNFYLNSHLIAAVQITDHISKMLMKDINPFFLTGLQSQNPAHIQISKEGFRVQISPFNKNTMRIQRGYLDMGKIKCQNGGSLNLAISLMKLGRFSGVKEMELWFTPVSFSLQNGIMHTGRMDFLIDNTVHLCTWGDINLVSNKIDMTLGLTKKSLERSFKITNLPSNYVLHIPIRGTTNDPKIDLASGAAKIGALVAGNAAGDVFGGFIKMFGKVGDEDTPPAKKPFPWE